MKANVKEARYRAAIGRISDRLEENLSVVGDGLDGWTRLGGVGAEQKGYTGFDTEDELTEARRITRNLAFTNEFAICGVENRISYIIGRGFEYNIVPRPGIDVAETRLEELQKQLDEFLESSDWWGRQVETQRRLDRDGEVFLRMFDSNEGLKIRYVEPEQIYSPDKTAIPDPAKLFGVQVDPEDVETVEGFWVDEVFIDVSEIQHRKAGVDRNVRRGVPLFFPVAALLRRVETIQENMDLLSALQTAIALVYVHSEDQSEASVRALSDGLATYGETVARDDGATDVRNVTDYPPGTVLRLPANQKAEFPTGGVDPTKFVAVKQSALRAVAAMVVMPEFMLTADASNANFASTMVAEGPSVKMFERLQQSTAEADKEILWKVFNDSPELKLQVDIKASPPRVAVRDMEIEARVNEIYRAAKVKSVQDITAELGLDYEEQQELIEAHEDRRPDVFPLVMPAGGEEDDEEEGDEEEGNGPDSEDEE